MERVDYITCKVCGRKLRSLGRHLQTHNITFEEYKRRFPEAVAVSETTRQLREETCLAHYGVDNPFKVRSIQERRKATWLSRYGVDNPTKDQTIARKAQVAARLSFFRRFGVFHNMHIPGVAEKAGRTKRGKKQSLEANLKRSRTVKQTFRERYGVGGPGGLTDRVKGGMLKKYGVSNPSQVPELKRKAIRGALKKPNNPESLIIGLDVPELKYTGDGSFIVQDPITKKLRVPDFKVRNQRKVVEHFGSFDHGPLRTGISLREHEKEVVGWYRERSYGCLVIWDCTKKTLSGARDRIEEFISTSRKSSETIRRNPKRI